MSEILPNLRHRVTPRRRRTADSAHRTGSRGFTILEIIVALALVAAVYAIALPSIARTRVSASVHNARHVVVSSISLARATAIRFGRPVTLRLDIVNDRLWVVADTALAGAGVNLVTLGHFSFAEELDVNLDSNRSTLCFNGRGIGTTTAACPQPGGVIVVSRAGLADTLIVSPTGLVLQYEGEDED